MALQVTPGANNTLKFNGKIKGFMLTAVLVNSTVNTANTGQLIDPNQITVTCRLQGKRTMQIYRGNLAPWHAICNFSTKPYRFVSGYESILVQLHTASVPEIVVVPFMVHFPTIDVGDGEEGFLDINFASGALSAQMNGTTSILYASPIKSEDEEICTPIFENYTLIGGSTSLSLGLGNGIYDVFLYNHDKGVGSANIGSALRYTNQIFTNMNMQSDLISQSFIYEEMIAWRFMSLSEGVDAPENIASAGAGLSNIPDYYGQSFPLLSSPAPLSNVSIDAPLVGANITGGQNILIWRRYVLNKQVAARGAAGKIQTLGKTAAKHGISHQSLNS